MSILRSRALEDEFCDVVRELGGDAEGRAQGDAYLEAAHPLVDKYGSSTWALTPKVFGSAEVDALSQAAETMGRIMDKVTARYLQDADFRKLFRLPAEVEELTLIPTGYEQLVPFARVDAYYDEEKGDYTFVGVVTDSAKGMTAAVDVTRAVQRSESYRRFAERHHSIETFDITDGVIAALRETYTSWANADEGTHHPERPVVGIVDYAESATEGEFADIIERLAEEGVFARFVDIRDLRIEEAAGTRRLVDSEGPIACVYRRALVSEMLEKPCEGVDALVEAARRGLACVIGGFRTWPVSTPSFFSVLCSDAIESVLDPMEVAFVRAHVIETHQLTADTDLAPYLADKDLWVARPAGAYTATAGGSIAGRDCETGDDWWRVLLACAQEGGVVQRMVPAYETPVFAGGAGAEGVDAGETVTVRNITGLYLFRGKFGGIHSRCGYEGPAGYWDHRMDMGTLVVSD